MPRRHRWHGRRKVAPLLIVTALVSAMSPVYLLVATPAEAASAPPSNYFTVVDPGGANNTPGQGDLTQLGRDDSDSSIFNLFWSWDDPSWNGANTGDACAQFDSNNNGDVDYAVCVEVGAGAGSTVVKSGSSPESLTCDDSRTDRCHGATSASSGATVGTLATFDTSAAADLTTDTDPFAGGSDAPNDSTVQVHIPKANLPSGATFVDVCSFPSIANIGNDDPKDCLANSGGGTLVVHKDAGNDTTTVFPFTVDPGNTSVSVTGTGASAPQAFAAGTNYSLSESVPGGWVFADAFCALSNGHVTGTTSSAGVDGFTIELGKVTNCYVEDDPQSPDMSLTKVASPTTFTAAGQTINYTLTATNTGNSDLTSVQISDPLLGGNLTNCTDAGGKTVTPPVDLAPGDKLICAGSYQTTAADVTAGKVVNTATARGFEFEESRIFRTATATVNLFVPPPPPPPATGSPNLGVTKASVPVSGSTVHRGDQVTYTLSYGNTGTAAASGVVLTDTLPADLDYVAGTASNGGAYDAATRMLAWQVGSLAAAANSTVTYTAQVAQTATDGEVLHNVGVITAPGITDTSNNDDVTVSVPTGAVTISKSVDKDVAGFGDTLTYSIKVGATGNKDQTHVVASDSVPTGTSYVDGSASCTAPCQASESDGAVTWNVGTLAAGTSTVATFKVTVDTPAPDANGGIPAETVSNVAQVSFDADPVETSNKVTTDITAVLGEKAVRPPKTQPTPEPSRLPFTGLPLLQLLMMSAIAIAFGSIATRVGRNRAVIVEAPLPIWRDQ